MPESVINVRLLDIAMTETIRYAVNFRHTSDCSISAMRTLSGRPRACQSGKAGARRRCQNYVIRSLHAVND